MKDWQLLPCYFTLVAFPDQLRSCGLVAHENSKLDSGVIILSVRARGL